MTSRFCRSGPSKRYYQMYIILRRPVSRIRAWIIEPAQLRIIILVYTEKTKCQDFSLLNLDFASATSGPL